MHARLNILLTILILVIIVLPVHGGQSDTNRRYPVSFFGEWYGTSLGAISFHMDAQVFRIAPIDLSVRVSTGFPFLASCYYWPVSIQNILFDDDNHVEFGGGIGHLVELRTRRTNEYGPECVNQNRFFNLGYRYEPATGGTVARVYLMWLSGVTCFRSNFWFGISIGTTI